MNAGINIIRLMLQIITMIESLGFLNVWEIYKYNFLLTIYQNAVDEEKSSRIKEIETILMDLEKRLEEMKTNKNEKIQYFDNMVFIIYELLD